MTPEQFLVWARLFPEPLFLVTGQGTILAVNEPAGTMVRRRGTALAGTSLFDLVTTPPTQVTAYLHACARTRSMLFGALTFRDQDGREQVCRVEGAVLQPRTAETPAVLLLRCRPKPQTIEPFLRLNERLLGLSKTYRQLQQAYTQLQEQREWFERTLTSIGDAVIATDPQGRVTLMNAVAEALTGWTEQDAQGRPITEVFDIVNMATWQVVENPVIRVLREGTMVGLANHTLLLARNGTAHPIDDSVAPIYAPDGRLLGVVLVFRDVTMRVQAEQARQQAQAALEQRVQERTALLEVMQDITRAANEASSGVEAMQYAVDRLCVYMGWPVGHAYLAVAPGTARWAPTDIWHLASPECFSAFQQATQTVELAAAEGLIGRVGALGKPEWTTDVATNVAVHRQQAARDAGLQAGLAVPVLVGAEVVGVLEFYASTPLAPEPALLEALTQMGTQLGRAIERERAATQAQRQQEALFQREKLAAMGALLASVAHELNNPLAVILLQTELLQQDADSGPLTGYAEEITRAAARCERLVRQFLTLARQHTPERTVVDLNALITGTVELLAPAFRVENIAVDLRLAADLPRLWADPYQLQQVLVNLVTNAQQALREVAAPRQVTLTTRSDPTQTWVTLEVADTGPGMAPDVRARIFEPFFTTKPPGVGTGLGLPLCQGIVESHGGAISLTSVPGQGSTFRVELPASGVPETAAAPAGQGDAPPTVRCLTVLLVDDEPGIASGLARLLRRDGHTVETAANGRVALARLRERPYDLILSDLRMPELDGPGLYRALAQHYPQLLKRFIFLTGDTLSPDTLAFFAQSNVPQLTKPFSAMAVRRAIAQVLWSEE